MSSSFRISPTVASTAAPILRIRDLVGPGRRSCREPRIRDPA
ncbi:hypothetical protein [Gulosibacter molinativorax]|nr:hypothetical protein [Gulosibacter molinativorax]